MLQTWIEGARPKTLPAAIVPVVVGTAIAVGSEPSGFDSILRFIAAMVVALSLQVATNFVNDYADGERGTDDNRVGPKRLVASGEVLASQVKKAAFVSFGVAGLAGLYLAAVVGWELIPLGAVCIAAGYAYTGGPRPYGYAGLGEVFVFIFFGLVATIGSYYVQTNSISWLSVLAGAAVGCWAVALLVTNNLRDIAGDTEAGKRTLATRIGDKNTRWSYVGLVVASVLFVLACVASRPLAVLSLVGCILFVPAVRQIMVEKATGTQLIGVLAQTGQAQLVAGILLGLGLAL